MTDISDSLLGRYTGEVRTFLEGDIEVAKQHIDVARLFVGILRNKLSLSGISYGRDYRRLPTGVIISVTVGGGTNQIQIYAPPSGENKDYARFPYLSGVYEIARVFDNDGIHCYALQYFPAFRLPNRTRNWYRLNTGFTDDTPFPLTPELLPKPQRSPPLSTFLWNWVDLAKPTLDFDFLELKNYPQWPTMYTGRMRMVAQKLLGRRLRNPYHYNCGIWLFDADLAGCDQQRWIIEIVPDAGVFAWPVKFYDEMALLSMKSANLVRNAHDTDRYDYGFESTPEVPTEISEDRALVIRGRGKADGHKLRLMTAEELQEAHPNGWRTATPWYSSWAFSYDGHEAQIVTFSTVKIGGIDIDYATRFKITVSGDAQGPSSASLTKVDEGYVNTGRFNYQFFAPRIYAVQEQIYWESLATTPDYDSPIYVFYDRDNREAVLRLNYAQGSTPADVIVDTLDCTTPGVVATAGWCPSDLYATTAEKCNSGEISSITNKVIDASLCFYCVRTFPAGEYSTYRIDKRVRWLGGAQGGSDWSVQCNLGGASYVKIRGFYIQVFESFQYPHFETKSFANRITLPIYEREGFFHCFIEDITVTSTYINTESSSTPPNSALYINEQQHPFTGSVQSLSPPYTIGGSYDIVVDTTITAGTVFSTVGYKYIGSLTSSNDEGGDSAVVQLEASERDDLMTAFTDNKPAVAASEAFSGKWAVFPEWDGAWAYSAEYPLDSMYRWQEKDNVRPVNICFTGDGTGDKNWAGGGAEGFIAMPPNALQKYSSPGSPIDLYAVGVPNANG